MSDSVPLVVRYHCGRCLRDLPYDDDLEALVCRDCGCMWMTDEEDAESEPLPCTGDSRCTASPHEHGCFSDYGDCDDPEDHDA